MTALAFSIAAAVFVLGILIGGFGMAVFANRTVEDVQDELNEARDILKSILMISSVLGHDPIVTMCLKGLGESEEIVGDVPFMGGRHGQ